MCSSDLLVAASGGLLFVVVRGLLIAERGL